MGRLQGRGCLGLPLEMPFSLTCSQLRPKIPANGRVVRAHRPNHPRYVLERAIETAALMLGNGKSRGYCLEMICADFLAGANLENGNPDLLLNSISHFIKFLPDEQRQTLVEHIAEKAS